MQRWSDLQLLAKNQNDLLHTISQAQKYFLQEKIATSLSARTKKLIQQKISRALVRQKKSSFLFLAMMTWK